LGGHALFTLKSLKSGSRYTYKVTAPRDENKDDPNVLFVSVLTGSDNTHNYKYIGYIKKEEFIYGVKSKIGFSAPSVIAFMYCFDLFKKGQENKLLEIWHEGKCCRCGRTLTVPESIESGIGPECARIKDVYCKIKEHE
jgi:hypothetical protein